MGRRESLCSRGDGKKREKNFRFFSKSVEQVAPPPRPTAMDHEASVDSKDRAERIRARRARIQVRDLCVSLRRCVVLGAGSCFRTSICVRAAEPTGPGVGVERAHDSPH